MPNVRFYIILRVDLLKPDNQIQFTLENFINKRQ